MSSDYEVERHVTIPQELLEALADYAISLRGEWSWKDGKTERVRKEYEELKEVIQCAVRWRESTDTLVCDHCGKLHPHDLESYQESCICGRFKQRMDWMKVEPEEQQSCFGPQS